jgi:nucleoside-diphosphate-sugar epimerase
MPSKPTKILVTGAYGQIGSELALKLRIFMEDQMF